MNYQAQPLQLHERDTMRADSAIVNRVITSYRLMLDFYGMKLVSEDTGLLDRVTAPRNYAHRYRNLVRASLPPCLVTGHQLAFTVRCTQARGTTTSGSRVSSSVFQRWASSA